MTIQMQELRAVVARLEKLERQNRRLRLGGVVVLTLAGVSLLMGQAKPPAQTSPEPRPFEKEIRANSFVVLDDGGHVRAELKADPVLFGGVEAALTLYDARGKPRACLGVWPGARERTRRVPQPAIPQYPFLHFFDPSGNRQVKLEARQDTAYVGLSPQGEFQRPTAQLAVAPSPSNPKITTARLRLSPKEGEAVEIAP